MLYTVGKLILITLLIYAIVPTLLARVLGLGAIKRGPQGQNKIFLTFDDGPDSEHTAQVLSILRQCKIKVIFFVTGHNAKKNPQMIKRMIQQGHTVGIHGREHQLAWLMSPMATMKDIRETSELIFNITGTCPSLYRPPWGVFNIANYFSFFVTGHRSVLWTFMCWDWTKSCTTTSITRRVSRRIKDGAIIVLHDSAGPVGACGDAPKTMVKALPLVIKEIKNQGYQIGTPNELVAWSGLNYVKRTVVSLWGLWEKCFAVAAGIKPLAVAKESVFKLAVRHHRGEKLELPDGTIVQPGDLLGEIHFDNNLLLNVTSQATGPEQAGIKLLCQVKKSLPFLAKVLIEDPKYKSIKAVVGVTLIHRGASFLGFSSYDINSTLLKQFITWYQRWLVVIFHPQGWSHLWKHRSKMVPKLLVMSKNELINRYYSPSVSGEHELLKGSK